MLRPSSSPSSARAPFPLLPFPLSAPSRAPLCPQFFPTRCRPLFGAFPAVLLRALTLARISSAPARSPCAPLEAWSLLAACPIFLRAVASLCRPPIFLFRTRRALKFPYAAPGQSSTFHCQTAPLLPGSRVPDSYAAVFLALSLSLVLSSSPIADNSPAPLLLQLGRLFLLALWSRAAFPARLWRPAARPGSFPARSSPSSEKIRRRRKINQYTTEEYSMQIKKK